MIHTGGTHLLLILVRTFHTYARKRVAAVAFSPRTGYRGGTYVQSPVKSRLLVGSSAAAVEVYSSKAVDSSSGLEAEDASSPLQVYCTRRRPPGSFYLDFLGLVSRL